LEKDYFQVETIVRSWEGMEEVVAIADTGTFAGAAKLLNVSNSHISKVIARLEARLQTQLFNRTTRRVSLTDTGHSFVEHSRRIIQERDELMTMVNGAGEPQGELRITCAVSLGERFVEPIVRDFMQQYPRLSVSLELTNRVIDLIGEGYDLAVRTGQVSDPRLLGQPIASRHLETAASPLYLAQSGVPSTVDDLKAHHCLIGTSTTWHFSENARSRLFIPQGRWRCNSGTAIAQAAAADMGICQLPLFYLSHMIATGRLRPILIENRAPPEPIWVVYPRRRHLLSKVRNLVDTLRARLQHQIDGAYPTHFQAADGA
jgi:DNA-binding transcriptional LysR family regulator